MQSDEKFQKAMKLLFRSNDQICVGNQYATDVGPIPLAPAAEFFCINPLATQDYRALNGEANRAFKIGSRADLNVCRFQNFLFEMDATPLNTQIEYIRSCNFPFATITFSGSKSYHAILSLETPLAAKPHTQKGVDEYKRTWKQLAHVMTTRLNQSLTLLDTSCQNPSRLSRMPGAWRADKKQHQELIQLGKLCSSEELTIILSEAPEFASAQKIIPVKSIAVDEEEIRYLIPIILMNQLRFPKEWASGTGAGNYQPLFKRILWLIDSTGATKEAATNLLEKYTFPYLLRTGYPIEKCYKAINDAYALKEQR